VGKKYQMSFFSFLYTYELLTEKKLFFCSYKKEARKTTTTKTDKHKDTP